MNKEKWFYVVSNNDWIISKKMISDIYLPIIKMDTLTFFNNLLNFNNNQKKYNLKKFVDLNCISEQTFWTHLHKLEALKLIDTYKTFNQQEEIYFIKLNNNPSFNEIMQDTDFRQLLEITLSEHEINNLIEIYANKLDINNLNDVSWNIKETFNLNKKQENKFDLNILKAKIYELTNLIVDINKQSYEFLKYVFNNFDWTYDMMADLLSKCIVDTKSNPHVSYHLMNLSFEEHLKPHNCNQLNSIVENAKMYNDNLNFEKPIQNQNEFVELNRNINIYDESFNIHKNQNALYDFQEYNAIQYVSSIHKKTLSNEFIYLIDELKEKYNFSDAIINVLFDFCERKNNGFFNKKYIEKIACTVYSQNIKNIELLIEHLRNAQKISNNKKNKSKSTVQQATIFSENFEKDDDGFN